MQDDFAALVEQARQMRTAGDRQGALGLFKRAEQTNPSHHGVMLEIASELRELDRQPERLSCRSSVVSLFDDLTRAVPLQSG